MTLRSKAAVVTGSTSGIGLAIARALAKEGADVLINGFGKAEEIEAIRASISAETGRTVVYSPADMTKPAEIAAMVAQALEAFGAVDILVNNAGIQHVAPIEDFPVEKWDAILAVNLSSAFHATRAAVPGMKAKGWGRIINTASAHSLVASPFKAAYVAAKHGIAGLTKTVALEVATSGITVNCISPGYVWTPLVERQIPDTMKAREPDEGTGHQRRASRSPADEAVRHGRPGRGARRLPMLRRREPDHRREYFDGRGMDGAVRGTGCEAVVDIRL